MWTSKPQYVVQHLSSEQTALLSLCLFHKNTTRTTALCQPLYSRYIFAHIFFSSSAYASCSLSTVCAWTCLHACICACLRVTGCLRICCLWLQVSVLNLFLYIFIPSLSVCLALKKSVCRCWRTRTWLFVSVCVCSARLCSAAALMRDSGSVCRELKPDVMQQESPSQQSQVPTAATEIISKHWVCTCVRACVYMYIEYAWVCDFVTLCTCSSQHTPVLRTHQGLSAGTLLCSCRERNCFQLFYKLLEDRKKAVELQHVPADIQCAFQYWTIQIA